MKLKWLSPCLLAFALHPTAQACSNVFIYGTDGVAAVARTMDLEFDTGNAMGYSGRDWANTSNINLPQKEPLNPTQWQNKYAYIGQTGFKSYILTDGLNSEGLYAAFLDLPNLSYYPTYNAQDSRSELGISDLVNYILGTSATVDEALSNLAKSQIIGNYFQFSVKGLVLTGGNGVHVIIRDKNGNSAVLEWTKYEGKPALHIYQYIAAKQEVIETIPGTKAKAITYKNTQGAVLTNAPDYGWQLKNASHYDSVFTGNTDKKWANTYQNGSGMAGIPGAWTPVDRFARGTQLARLMPKPQTEQQALALSYEAIETMQVPVAANPSSTLWLTVSDLQNAVYYFRAISGAFMVSKNKTSYITLPPFNQSWASYDVKQLAEKNKTPKNWVSVMVKPMGIATQNQAQFADKMLRAATPGNSKIAVKFVPQ